MLEFRALHNIDLSQNHIISKEIPDDFAAFTNDYLKYARDNEVTKKYSVIDPNTQVFSCIWHILELAYENSEITADIEEQMANYAKSIAMRLIKSEFEAQEKVAQMGTRIKKGSLIQALIEDNTQVDHYFYIVAKVEHSEFFEGDSLKKSFGFPTEKKNVWKSAVIPISILEGEVRFGSIRIYTDNNARYWSKEFLEVEEEQSDETNTKKAFEAIDTVLKRELKVKHARDYLVLRNAAIQAMKTPQLINYNDFVESLVGHYQPEDLDVNTSFLKTKLLRLPVDKHFDTQFTTVPKAVTAHRNLRFVPIQGIEIRLDGGIDNFREVITADFDVQHRHVLIVHCPDLDTYKAFGGK